MTHKNFDDLQDQLFAEIQAMKSTKGKEYANSDDRLANFKRLAEELDCPARQVCWIYTKKHLDAIASYCRTGQTFSSENFYGRVLDAMLYLNLLLAIQIEEEEQNSQSA